jgi:SAM-dependent methyltransferase
MSKQEKKFQQEPVAEPSTVEPIKLNLGCGFTKLPGYVNIDQRDVCKPDLQVDAYEYLMGLASNTVDEIRAYDFMEHVPQPIVVPFLKEIHRVLKPEGIFDFFIPSTDGRGAFQDPTHISFWNINNWLYYCDPDWHALYPDLPYFRLLEIGDFLTSEKLRIVHTKGKVSPIK